MGFCLGTYGVSIMSLWGSIGSAFKTTASIVGDVFSSGVDLIADGAAYLFGGYESGSFDPGVITSAITKTGSAIGSGLGDFLGVGDSYGGSALDRASLKLPMDQTFIEGVDSGIAKKGILSQAADWAEKHPVLTQAALGGVGSWAANEAKKEAEKKRHERDLELLDARADATKEARGFYGSYYGVPGADGGDPIDRRKVSQEELIAAASASPVTLRGARQASEVYRPTVVTR